MNIIIIMYTICSFFTIDSKTSYRALQQIAKQQFTHPYSTGCLPTCLWTKLIRDRFNKWFEFTRIILKIWTRENTKNRFVSMPRFSGLDFALGSMLVVNFDSVRSVSFILTFFFSVPFVVVVDVCFPSKNTLQTFLMYF